jgi:hypothetical protein
MGLAVLALPVWTPGRIPRGFQAPPTGSYQEYGGSPAATSAAGLVRAARPISAAASASRVLRAAPVGIPADEHLTSNRRGGRKAPIRRNGECCNVAEVVLGEA